MMQMKQFRGLFIAAGYVVGVMVVLQLPVRYVPVPFDYLIFPIITILTFFVARKIPIDSLRFGFVALTVLYIIMAYIFKIRGPNEDMTAPLMVAIMYTVAFLAGFIGYRLQHQLTQSGT